MEGGVVGKARDDGGRPRIFGIMLRPVECITVVLGSSEVALEVVYVLTATEGDGLQHGRLVENGLKDS